MKRSVVIGVLALGLAAQPAAACEASYGAYDPCSDAYSEPAHQAAQPRTAPRQAAGVADDSVLIGAAVLAPLLIGAALAAGKGGGGGGAAVGTITGGTPTTTPSTTGTN